jgi:hypothetical protein
MTYSDGALTPDIPDAEIGIIGDIVEVDLECF